MLLLVTGISGLTGRFLYNKLKASSLKRNVCYFVRPTSDTSWMEQDEILHYGDVNDTETLTAALSGVRQVIHLVNIRSSPQIIEACKRQGIQRVIFVNTTGMYSKYQQYAELYRELEQGIVDSGLDYTIIRPTMIYGNQQDKNIHKLILLMHKWRFFPVPGNGNALMQPIYAGDLADVILSACLRSKVSSRKAYNVAGQHPLTYNQLLHEIQDALGKRVSMFHIPISLAKLAGRIGDVVPNGLVNYERIQRLEEDKTFDYSKAKQDLDFNPISFSEGVKYEVQALRYNGLL